MSAYAALTPPTRFDAVKSAAVSFGHCVIDTTRVLYALRSVQHFQADDIAVLVLVEDHAGFVLIALFDSHVAENNLEHIHLGL